MHVAGLQADDGGAAVARLESRGERGGLDPALVVGGDRLGGAEAQVAQREVDGVVPLGADQDAYAGRVGQALGDEVPAVAAQHLVAGGGQAGEVGHRPAGHEADGTAGRQAEQVQQPGLGEVLHGRVGGGEQPQPGVLVPGADQPVHREGGRVGAPDDEAEEATTRDRGQPGVAGGGQLVDDRRGVGRSVGEDRIEPCGHFLGGQARRHRALGEGVEPLEGMGVGAVEAGTAVAVHLVSVGPVGLAVEGSGARSLVLGQ